MAQKNVPPPAAPMGTFMCELLQLGLLLGLVPIGRPTPWLPKSMRQKSKYSSVVVPQECVSFPGSSASARSPAGTFSIGILSHTKQAKKMLRWAGSLPSGQCLCRLPQSQPTNWWSVGKNPISERSRNQHTVTIFCSDNGRN